MASYASRQEVEGASGLHEGVELPSYAHRHVGEPMEKLADPLRCYPEYRDRRIVGVLASPYPDIGIVNRATGRRLWVMVMGGEAMQVLNPDALQAPGNLPPPRSD